LEERAVLVFLTAWAGIATILFYLKGFFTFPVRSESEPPRVTGWQLLLVALLCLLSYLFIAPLITALLVKSLSLPTQDLAPWGQLIGVVTLSLVLTLFLIALGPSRRSLFTWAIPARPWRDFGTGLVTWLFAFPVTTLCGQLIALLLLRFLAPEETEQVAVRQLHEAFGDNILVFANAICIVFFAPVIEELLFRGFIQTWLKSYLGRWSILLSAFVFASLHYSASQKIIGNLSLLIPLFLLGVLLGFLYERQKSLWAPIGLHMLYNGFGTLALLGSWVAEMRGGS
jgi:CAAX protease family protein